MKKIILTVAAIFAIGFASAQEKPKETYGLVKGDMWVEGGFNVQSASGGNPGDVKVDYSLTPKIGWMHDDKLAYGGFLDLSGGKYFNDNKFHTYGIGAFARWYGLTLGEKKAFNAYTELGVGYSKLKNENTTDSSQNTGALNVSLDVGMNYFFTKQFAAVFTLANIISYNNSNPENGSNTSNITVNVNLFNNIFAQPKFGLLYRW